MALATIKSAGTHATLTEADHQPYWPSLTLASAITAGHSHEKNEITTATAPTKTTKLAAGEGASAGALRAGDAAANDAIDATQGHAKYAKHALISITSMRMVLLLMFSLDRGDHLEIPRQHSLFNHHGIGIGDGNAAQ